MGSQAMVKHSLSLVLRLIDSTTGKEILEHNVMFRLSQGIKRPIVKGNGVYLFINIPREDFELEVHVYGYEPKKAKIYFSDLDEQIPFKELYLLPLDYPAGGKEILTLRGKMLGIKAIEAVPLNEVVCSMKEYEERKSIMTIMNPHNVRFSRIHYGLLNTERTQYEKIQIEKEISKTQVKLKQKLQKEWRLNQAVVPIIFGEVSEDGNYLLKVADSNNPIYLIRYIVDNKIFFQKMNFHQMEELMEGGNTWES